MLRGSEMLFAALFAVLCLKRRLNKWHFMGVALSMVSLKDYNYQEPGELERLDVCPLW